MSEEIKEIYNGGPAFPLDLMVGDDHRWGHGMSLRDYFASEAMNGMCAKNAKIDIETIVDASYKIADMMIVRRQK